MECGRKGYYLDVSNTEAAGVFKNASRQLEANETNLQSATSMMADPNPMLKAAAVYRVFSTVAMSGHIVEQARPQERMRDVQKIMQGQVDTCLRERGYVRFQLTRDQRKQLQRLHLGSPARHDYLFKLSSDPTVLVAQATGS